MLTRTEIFVKVWNHLHKQRHASVDYTNHCVYLSTETTPYSMCAIGCLIGPEKLRAELDESDKFNFSSFQSVPVRRLLEESGVEVVQNEDFLDDLRMAHDNYLGSPDTQLESDFEAFEKRMLQIRDKYHLPIACVTV